MVLCAKELIGVAECGEMTAPIVVSVRSRTPYDVRISGVCNFSMTIYIQSRIIPLICHVVL